MSQPFGSEYASAYDDLYGDKDYGQECHLIDRLLQRYGKGTVRNLLDLGCGTGSHAIPLAECGYRVAGVDRSADMVERAREKAASRKINGNAEFYRGDIRDCQLNDQFDASLMMFAVLGYQLGNSDVLQALRTARKHTRQGGLFLFDVWYGPAVLRQGPSERVKNILTANGQILRMASGRLDIERHLCDVSYHLWRLDGQRLVGETKETHQMRYFFPLELNLFLECSGFTSLRLGSFPEFDRDPDQSTWNVCCVARAT